MAIGTDHSTSLSPVGPQQASSGWPRVRPIWESYWLDKSVSIVGLEREYDSMAWTNWPLFTVGLVQRGYSDDEIRKIIGGNVLRVCEETLA